MGMDPGMMGMDPGMMGMDPGMMGMDPGMMGMGPDPMGMDPMNMGNMGQMYDMGMQMGMDPGQMMDMGMQMGMDPSMMQNFAAEMGFDPAMAGNQPPGGEFFYYGEGGEPPPGQYYVEGGELPPGQYYGEGGELPPGQYYGEGGELPPGQYYGEGGGEEEFREGPPQEGEEEEENNFFPQYWNGQFYDYGQEYQFYQAQAQYPMGWMNGGMGSGGGEGGGGGGGSNIQTAMTGVGGFDFGQNLIGSGGVADTFVFSLGNYQTTGTTSSIDKNVGGQTDMQMGMAAQFDSVVNFSRVDGDKIKIFDTDGATPITSLTSAGLTSTELMFMSGNYFLKTTDGSVVFASDFEVLDSDLTTV